MLKVLEERDLPVSELLAVASDRSAGRMVVFRGKEVQVIGMEMAVDMKPDLALFSAGGSTSLEWAPRFAEVGCTVIDNSSAWRMHADKKLVVPEVNGDVLTVEDRIIANPNCSTIQLVMALAPLHQTFRVKRVVVSTYQAVTGTGTPGTTFAGQGVDGSDAVVGTTGADDDTNGALIASLASLALVKAAAIADPFGGSEAVPGAVITYTLTATVAGSGSISDLRVTDIIPTGTTYEAGTLALDAASLTDADDADAGKAGASGIDVLIGSAAAGSNYTITFNVKIDAQQIRQALTNLIKNAGEATETWRETHGPDPAYVPNIRVQSRREDGHAVITIADNGIGLPEDRARLFEPYVTTRDKGTGLGLPIVKKIIEEHGGSLALEDAPAFEAGAHAGAMAVIRLPVTPVHEIELDQKQEAV